jgi:YegS/Rv2252/BmrU family lipid kinase
MSGTRDDARVQFGTVPAVSSKTLVILNPASAAGRTGRRRREILHKVESVLGWVDLESTSAPGDATKLAREAVVQGISRILVAGGDGTTNEVVSGLLESGRAPESQPTLGLLPLGSGLDLARSLGLPRDLDAALEIIDRGGRRRIDAGRLEYLDSRGRPSSRFFVNEASTGLSGVTVQRVGRLAKRLGPRLAFVVGAVVAILAHRPVEGVVEIDGKKIYEGPITMAVAANGRYFGAGMHVAPRALLDDGELEVALVRGLSVPRLLANLPLFYVGQHGRHSKVSFYKGRVVEIKSRVGSAPIELDGEAVGGLPMRAEVLPEAIEFFVPEPVPVSVSVKAPARRRSFSMATQP